MTVLAASARIYPVKFQLIGDRFAFVPQSRCIKASSSGKTPLSISEMESLMSFGLHEQQGLTSQAFNRFLYRLHPEPAAAAEAYEELRLILLKFFEWHDSWFPDEDADETINRVIRKNAEDEGEIQNVTAYALGVARLVHLEMLRAPDRRRVELESLPPLVSPAEEVFTESTEDLHECFQSCLQSLPTESQTFLQHYYQDQHRARIEQRQRMAQDLGLTAAALRRRAKRLRERLEQCVHRCRKRTESERRNAQRKK